MIRSRRVSAMRKSCFTVSHQTYAISFSEVHSIYPRHTRERAYPLRLHITAKSLHTHINLIYRTTTMGRIEREQALLPGSSQEPSKRPIYHPDLTGTATGSLFRIRRIPRRVVFQELSGAHRTQCYARIYVWHKLSKQEASTLQRK